MIKAVIVDDETKSREVLNSIITKCCADVTLSGMADGVASGAELIRNTKPDIVFLDIEMADGTGFDLIEKVQDLSFSIIFTTAFDKYAVKAIKYSALDYLLKPIDADELTKAVAKVIEKKSNVSTMENLKFLMENFKRKDENYNKITLPTGNAFEIVNVKDIVRCEAEGSYTNFILSDKRKLMVSASMKHYEDLLPENDFIRVHHHHLININHVVRFLKSDGGYAVMTDGSEVEISRRKKDFFMQRMHKM